MRRVSIWEIIIFLCGPGEVRLVLRSGVDGGGGIKDIHTAIKVGVVNELVQILEPRVCIEVVEVGPHGQHDIVLVRVHTSIGEHCVSGYLREQEGEFIYLHLSICSRHKPCGRGWRDLGNA